MCVTQTVTVRASARLHHIDAAWLSETAVRGEGQLVVIEMGGVRDASTAAFARLVLLRRELLAGGRDLRLAGLSGRAASIFEVHRLQSVLPAISEPPVASRIYPTSVATVAKAKTRPDKSNRKRRGLACFVLHLGELLSNHGLVAAACANGQGD